MPPAAAGAEGRAGATTEPSQGGIVLVPLALLLTRWHRGHEATSFMLLSLPVSLEHHFHCVPHEIHFWGRAPHH